MAFCAIARGGARPVASPVVHGASIADFVAAARSGSSTIYGVTPPFAAYAAARLVDAYPDSSLVVVCSDEAAARRFTEDIALFAPPRDASDPAAPPPALAIPALDTSPYADLRVDREALARRMATLFRLARQGPLMPAIVALSAPSLLRKVIPQG